MWWAQRMGAPASTDNEVESFDKWMFGWCQSTRNWYKSVREALSSKPYELDISKSWLKETAATNKETNRPSVVLTEATGVVQDHHKYKKGYWMNNEDIVFVACALLEEANSDDMMYTTAYDVLARCMSRTVNDWNSNTTKCQQRALSRSEL